MRTRKEILEYGLSFPGTYQDAPFHDPNWILVRCCKNKKAFLWTYERNGQLCINVKVDAEWRDFWRSAYTSVLPGYHQNKNYWNTIVLDGTVPKADIQRMIARAMTWWFEFMKKLDITTLSTRYSVRRLKLDDAERIYTFCKKNTQYYKYCGKELSRELVEQDLQITPPGISPEEKYYIGFFENNMLVAVMDLIVGYPDCDHAYIGFFMMNYALQGRGIGSIIISDVFAGLHNLGLCKCQLGIDKNNSQSKHFWRKNGFEVVREVNTEEGIILVAEKQI